MAAVSRRIAGLLFGLMALLAGRAEALDVMVTLTPDCTGQSVILRVFSGLCTAHPGLGALLGATCSNENAVRLTFYQINNNGPDSGNNPVCSGYRLGFNTVTTECTPIGNVYAKIVNGTCRAQNPVYLAATYSTADCDIRSLASDYWFTLTSGVTCLNNNYFPGYNPATVSVPTTVGEPAIDIRAFTDADTCLNPLTSFRGVTINSCKPFATGSVASIKIIAAPAFNGIPGGATTVSVAAALLAGLVALASALA